MAASLDRQSPGTRVRDHARWIGLVMLAGLVPLGLGAAVLIRESDRAARTQQDARLSTTASSEAAALAQSLGRARALLRLSAASPVWRDAVAAPGPLRATVAAGGRPMRRVHTALAELRAGYGGRLAGVADAIDSSGREFAADRPGGAVPITLLAGGKTRAPFFGPSLSLPPGAVYQTEPYISPDSLQWVVSNSTTATVGEHDRVVIQLEVPVESLRREALQQGRGSDASVIDARTGLVVFDSSDRRGIGAMLAPRDLRGLQRVTRAGLKSGLANLGARRIAFRHLPQAGANANDWYVVVDAPHPPGFRPTGSAQFVLALMVLALGGLGLGLGRQSAAVRREAE